MNFIDGLDGLAAGRHRRSPRPRSSSTPITWASDGFTDIVAPPTLLAAAARRDVLGFLPHNFSPARIFMGDSGSMLRRPDAVGRATTATTSTDPQVFDDALGSLPLLLPLLIPAVGARDPVRSTCCSPSCAGSAARHSPFAPDKRAPAPPAARARATATGARCCCSTSGRRWSPSAGIGLSFEHSQVLVVTPVVRARGGRRAAVDRAGLRARASRAGRRGSAPPRCAGPHRRRRPGFGPARGTPVG